MPWFTTAKKASPPKISSPPTPSDDEADDNLGEGDGKAVVVKMGKKAHGHNDSAQDGHANDAGSPPEPFSA